MSNLKCVGYKELKPIVGGVARVTLVRWSQLPHDPFPGRVMIGRCRVCWWLHEVIAWLERRSRK